MSGETPVFNICWKQVRINKNTDWRRVGVCVVECVLLGGGLSFSSNFRFLTIFVSCFPMFRFEGGVGVGGLASHSPYCVDTPLFPTYMI